MHKRLAVYSIAEEKTRLAFCAAIYGIDENCVDIIDDHAIAFHSDKSLKELHQALVSSCTKPGDDVWILTLEKPFTGSGISLDDLRAFLSK
jgi:hypothetical protein